VDANVFYRRDILAADAPRWLKAEWVESRVYPDPTERYAVRMSEILAVRDFVGNYIPSQLQYTPEESEMMTDFQNNVRDFIRNKTATWIVDGGLDAEWDAYVSKLEEFGVEDYVALIQEKYDTYFGF
jgi:putative aldouronate transport system substrate-binding protein